MFFFFFFFFFVFFLFFFFFFISAGIWKVKTGIVLVVDGHFVPYACSVAIFCVRVYFFACIHLGYVYVFIVDFIM